MYSVNKTFEKSSSMSINYFDRLDLLYLFNLPRRLANQEVEPWISSITCQFKKKQLIHLNLYFFHISAIRNPLAVHVSDNSYIANMSKSGTWVDHVAIQSLLCALT